MLPKDPKRRRIFLGAAAAAVVVLLLLSRRGGGSQAPAADEQQGATYGASAPFGSTFADNGEAAGQLGTAITDSLSGVSEQLSYVGATNEAVADALRTEPAWATGLSTQFDSLAEQLRAPNDPPAPAIAPGPVGTTGSTAAKTAQKKDRLGRTYAQRQKIKAERAAGNVGPSTGLTPTERTLLRSGTPAAKKQLRKKVQTHRAAARRTPSQRPRKAPKPPARRRRRR